MNTKNKVGQIIKIPENFVGYHVIPPHFSSKFEELEWYNNNPKYTLFDGVLIGQHNGLENYKIGQRKGIINLGQKKPLYVIDIDVEENRLLVGEGYEHPGLFSKVFFLKDNEIVWIDETKKIPNEAVLEKNKIQNRANVFSADEGFYIEFERPVRKSDLQNSLKLLNNNILIGFINI
ncbi:tRNA methyl transferase PRC-barrel domain-containing protein [uncultured Chryseobacterium sp.]|uniref:tRNA methyl transferase PRC-barrel domain-containing protein n=1 Tax=uncultured Chryseobacterium sp. TaxID=259322 RepID=UPI00262AF524|nr:tRNA methyl transferase PRC-barrel domain-containing protein [uncultured Chryseobacterium sp.]